MLFSSVTFCKLKIQTRESIHCENVQAYLYVRENFKYILLLSKIEKLFHIITKSFVLVITLSFLDGSIKLNNASQLLLPDIEAENGVVHVIDHALSPPPETGFLIGVGK